MEIMKDVVLRTVEKGGKVLIPVFAVGRSQEVMLVMENMVRNGEIPRIPIYLDGMIWEATAIHTAYPEYLNDQLRDEIFNKNHNPFTSEIFNKVDSMEARADLCASEEPCIVLATSGMLNGGPVMEYLKSPYLGYKVRESLKVLGPKKHLVNDIPVASPEGKGL